MKWVSGLGLVVFVCVGLVACRPSRESLSAGQVGCDPGEISISGEDSSSGFFGQSSQSWVAECHGRTFICSELDTAGKEETTGVVSCHEQLTDSPPPDKSHSAAPAAQSSVAVRSTPAANGGAPPTGGAGFTLGAEMSVEQQACEAAGNTWQSATESRASCSGAAADLGFSADIKLTFCHRRACIITVRHQPTSDWINTMAELKGKLSTKYGAPVEADAVVPEGCRSEKEFEACLRDQNLRLKFAWAWPTGERIALEIGKSNSDPEPAIRIDYTKPMRKVDANADAL